MPEMTQNEYVYTIQPAGPSKLLTPVVTVLLVLLITGSACGTWFGAAFLNYFALNTPQVMGWKIWQFFTYCFMDLNWIAFIVDISIILFMGSAVERNHDSKTLAFFCAVAIPLFGLLALPVLILFPQIPYILGGDILLFGIPGMFAYSHRKQKMMLYFWVVEADKAAWLVVFLNGLLAIFWPVRLIFIPAAFLGWWYMKLKQRGKFRFRTPSFSKAAGQPGKRSEGFIDID